MIRVGLLGFGYWGPQLARNIRATEGMELTRICDKDSTRIKLAHQLYPDVKSYASPDLPGLDAVVIATPTSSHYELASQALDHGIHVLVTKPMAASLWEAERLAERNGPILIVDHTFLFTGAVRKAKELLPSLGKLSYIDSVRINLGLFQSDCDVVCDLAPHDFSILLYLLEQMPSHIQVTSPSEATAYVTLWFDDGPLAHIHLNWLSPVKVRRILIGGDEKMMIYDEEEPSEKIKVYDSGVTPSTSDQIHAALWDYRMGDCFSPHLDRTEALALEMAHFRDCIKRNRHSTICGPEQGVAVCRMLDSAKRSLELGGALVSL